MNPRLQRDDSPAAPLDSLKPKWLGEVPIAAKGSVMEATGSVLQPLGLTPVNAACSDLVDAFVYRYTKCSADVAESLHPVYLSVYFTETGTLDDTRATKAYLDQTIVHTVESLSREAAKQGMGEIVSCDTQD